MNIMMERLGNNFIKKWYTLVKEVATMLKEDFIGGNYSLHLFSYLDTCPVLMENLNLQNSEKNYRKVQNNRLAQWRRY